MPASVILRIIVTGFVAIVPSAKNSDLTRLIVPNFVVPSAAHPHFPEHYAFIDLPKQNYVREGSRRPDFSYRDPRDNHEHVVFILHSETVELSKRPINRHLKVTDPPSLMNLVRPPAKRAIGYAIHIEEVCSECSAIDNDYFDVVAHPKLVAARMDLYGGDESVEPPDMEQVWTFDGTKVKQPLADEVEFRYKVAPDEHLVLRRGKEVDAIHLAGSDVKVTIGNTPLRSIMFLNTHDLLPRPKQPGEHFAAFYELYYPTPKNQPIPEPASEERRVLRIRGTLSVFDLCVPAVVNPQDPERRASR